MAPGLGALVGTLCWATFLITSTGTALAPFLLELSRDLRADLAAIANLMAVTSVAWGVMSLGAGTASDRVGRRPILVAGILTLGGSRLGLAVAETYGWAVAWQFVGGLGGGAFMGTVFATVSDRVPAATALAGAALAVGSTLASRGASRP